eukprot:GILI01014005.1.p1 GENE.GILI01014005.1~~GILI01014005.1.p1  ORF type:complete len:867 (-),score=183.71 GILI01014005.1:53-2323(-)
MVATAVPPKYAVAQSSQREAVLVSEEVVGALEEVDVLRSLFGEASEEEANPITTADFWQAVKDNANVEGSLRALRSVVAIPGGAQCLLERTRSDLDSATLASSHRLPITILAHVLIPLLTQDTISEACGSNLLPVARKELSEMGGAVVLCATILAGYPSACDAVISVVSGVPRPATHSPHFKATMRQAEPEAIEASSGCPMLLQLAMAAAEGLQGALVDYYVGGCVAGGGAGYADADEDPEADLPIEVKERRAMMRLWAAVDDEQPDEREVCIEAARKEAIAILTAIPDWRRKFCGRQSTAGGTWDLCFGLVGKPSAGKSSFFSAASRTPAKVGSYPFTTIEPNVSPAFAPMACPCKEYYHACDSEATASTLLRTVACGAEHSCVYDPALSTSARIRRQPVLLKDVAGLVKGAYKGTGKGNRFLNDLCDADVLIHVVDGAGATNADGWECTVGEGSPLSDVEWVRNEVHSWVFDNVRDKWEAIRRKPTKFREMFSGYRASMLLVDIALSIVGIKGTSELAAAIPKWRPEDLHRFVSLFIFIRFPMVLAVNKMDLDNSAVVANGERIAAANPIDIVACLSAKEELALNEAIIKSFDEDGSPAATATGAGLTSSTLRMLEKAAAGSAPSRLTFGLQNVLRAAVEACLPIAIYPTADLGPLLAAPSPEGLTELPAMLPTVLKHCTLIRPGTSVEAAKASFLNIPNNRKLVRIEAVPVRQSTAASPQSPPIQYPRKVGIMHPADEFAGCCFLHVMTNAKA